MSSFSPPKRFCILHPFSFSFSKSLKQPCASHTPANLDHLNLNYNATSKSLTSPTLPPQHACSIHVTALIPQAYTWHSPPTYTFCSFATSSPTAPSRFLDRSTYRSSGMFPKTRGHVAIWFLATVSVDTAVSCDSADGNTVSELLARSTCWTEGGSFLAEVLLCNCATSPMKVPGRWGIPKPDGGEGLRRGVQRCK